MRLYSNWKAFTASQKVIWSQEETEKETAAREIYEELGLKPAILDGFRAIDEHVIPNKKNTMKQIIYFLAEYSDQEIKFCKSEILSAPLVTFEEAMDLFEYESSKRILRDANEFINGGRL